MSQASATTCAPDFRTGTLYRTLVRFFPAFVDRPFADDARLNVSALAEAIGVSSEGIYKWLRADRVTPKNAKTLIAAASAEPNLAALRALGRDVPTSKDFHDVLFDD
jgi:hypothetical protein